MKDKTPLYPDFESLLRKNKFILKFFGGRGILRAVWDTRQSEIDALKKDLAEYSETMAWYKREIVDLKDEIKLLEGELIRLREQGKKDADSLRTAKENEALMERVQKMAHMRLEKELREKSELAASAGSMELALLQQDERQSVLEEELRKEKESRKRAEQELAQARARIRGQKRLNGQMGEELLKLSAELEKVHSPQE